MVLLNNFDPFEDFWQSNPQLRVLFKDEYKARVSSQYMWALFLYGHPSSKFFNETPQTRKDLIYKDYLLSDPAFKWEDYDSTLKTLEEHCLTKAPGIVTGKSPSMRGRILWIPFRILQRLIR